MDKDLFKKVLRDSGIPVARHVALREGDPVQNPFGFPCFVKPARLGSSVGISKAHDEAELEAAVALAFRHDDKILVEEFLDGIEVEVGVLGNREPIASIPGQIVPLGHEWYDYESKYDDGGMELVIPPDLPEDVLEAVQRAAVESFRVTECEGMARVDCFVRRRQPRRHQRAEHDSRLHLDECLCEVVRCVRHSLRSTVAPVDRARRRATRAPLEARVLGLAEGVHFVHVRRDAGRELCDPDEVVALRRRLLDREPRGASDDAALRDLLPQGALDVRRADLGGETRRVRVHCDPGELNKRRRIENEPDAGLVYSFEPAVVLLGRPVRRGVPVGCPGSVAVVLGAVAVRVIGSGAGNRDRLAAVRACTATATER